MTLMQVRPMVPRAAGFGDTSDGVAAMFIDWLGLVDSDGGHLAKYQLTLHPSYNLLSQLCGVVAEIVYTAFLVISAHAAALMNILLEPDMWLDPLADAYSEVTARVYSVFPPTLLGIATFSFLVFKVFWKRAPAGPAAQVSKAQWDQVRAGIVLLGVVALLATNPFGLIRQALHLVLDAAGWLTTHRDVGIDTAVTSKIGDTIRELTFLINYHSSLGADCATLWSKTMNVGGTYPDCLNAAQWAATKPDTQTVLAGVVALGFAIGLAYFTGIVAVHIGNQLSLTIAYLTGAVYPAVFGMGKRRAFDPVLRALAKCGQHGAMTLAFWFIAGAVPGLLIFIVSSVLTVLPNWLQIAVMSAAFYYSAKILRGILDKQETIYQLFRDRIESSQQWTALYANNSHQTTSVLGHTVDGALEHPKQWISGQYRATSSRWAAFKQSLKNDVEKEAATMRAAAIIPDPPEFAAATASHDTYHPEDAGQQQQTVTGSAVTSSTVFGQTLDCETGAADHRAGKIVTVTADGDVIVGRPAGPADLIADVTGSTTDEQQPIYFRGGIPQTSSPVGMISIEQPPAADVSEAGRHAAQPSTADAVHRLSESMADYWRQRDELYGRIRTQAGELNGHPRNRDAQIEAATASYGIGDSIDAASAATLDASVAHRVLSASELRSILDSAARAQRLAHNRNLLRARGISAPVTISDDDETAEQLIFVTGRDGRNRVERRNNVGFGDVV